MYYLFHSTDHETAKNTKNTKRPSFEASAYMQQKGFPITKVLSSHKMGICRFWSNEEVACKGCFFFSVSSVFYFSCLLTPLN